MIYRDQEVPGLIEAYFGAEPVRENHPVIASAFIPGQGWTNPREKPVTVSRLRRMARTGVTDVAVTIPGRTADFSIAEIIRHANRPLLGGRVI